MNERFVEFTTAEVLSLTGVLLLGFAASLGMAFNIDAVAESFAVANAQAGMVASAEMGAIAIGTLITARTLGRFAQRRVYTCCLLVVILSNLMSVLAGSLVLLVLCRLLSGFALGALVATVMATAGRSHTPEKTFGLINGAVGAMGILVAFLLPRALFMSNVLPQDWQISKADGLFLIYALSSLLGLALVLRAPEVAPASADTAQGAEVQHSTLPPLLGLGVLFFGHALLAVFLVRLGREAGMEPTAIGTVLMAGGLVGMLAPLLMGHLGGRVPAVPVVLLILILLAVLGVLLPRGDATLFMFITPVFAALPIAAMPLILGAAAKTDPSGRIAASHPAFVMLGGAAAPICGGWLSDVGSFQLNGWLVAASVAMAVILMLPMLKRADALTSIG